MAAHYIASSDIKVAKNIYRSMQSKYNKKHLPYGERAVNLVIKALPILQKELDLPKDLQIRIASVKGRIKGWYASGKELAIVDYINNGRGVLETLCHELVHAEQYKQGRLRTEFVKAEYVDFWMDSPVKAAYQARPWELEAFQRQVGLADRVIKQLGESILTINMR